MSGALQAPERAHVQPGQLEPLAKLMANIFVFQDLALFLYRCTGERVMIEVANSEWLPLRVAYACLEYAEKKGLLKPFLGQALEARPSSTSLRDMVLAIVPGLKAEAEATKQSVDRVVMGLKETHAQLGDQGVRQAMQASRVTLQSFADNVAILAAYKSLHDRLHTLHVSWPEGLVSAADALAVNAEPVSKLKDFDARLEECALAAEADLDELPSFTLRGAQSNWIRRLKTALLRLQTALSTRNPGLAKVALQDVQSIIERQMANLNEQIALVAKNLPVDELTVSLSSAAKAAGPLVGTKLEQACTALSDVRATLVRRVVDHELWQATDDQFWRLDDAFIYYGNDVFGPFTGNWFNGAKEEIRTLAMAAPEEPWPKKILDSMERIDDELARMEGEARSNSDARTPEAARNDLYACYVDLRRYARLRFYAVDQSLKRDSRAIVAIGNPLRAILEGLDNG